MKQNHIMRTSKILIDSCFTKQNIKIKIISEKTAYNVLAGKLC